VPAEAAPLYASFGTSAREGWAEHVTTAVFDLTGRVPVPLRDVLAASRQALAA
jgi:NAD(P)H dehydrogenase (quinone)